MTKRVSRRRALKTVVAAAAALPLVHIRTAGAAGKLSLAIWDHWVPSGNAALKKLVDAWAEKNKVNVQLDFLTGVGEKINITMAAEAQARTGHDVYAFDMWTVHEFADKLVPVDDMMKELTGKYGKVAKAYEYLGAGLPIIAGDHTALRQHLGRRLRALRQPARRGLRGQPVGAAPLGADARLRRLVDSGDILRARVRQRLRHM